MSDPLDFAVPLWAWLALGCAIAVMLAVDLLAHRDDHEIGFREASLWSAFWIVLAVGFGGVVAVAWGGEAAATYFSAYLIEKALSVDNVFVFALVFTAFSVPARYQHRVLFWGVLGALGMRLVLIFAGASLLETFFWTAYVFGAFLVWTGWRMAFHHAEPDPERNLVVRLLRRVVPVSPEHHGNRFVVRAGGRRAVTLLFVALVAIEATDLVFAIDSVAAVLAITTNTFIVWASIAFAVLGLRALYFCLAGLRSRFVHLHYGLAALQGVAGLKLILSETPVGKLPVGLTLGIIVVVLAAAVVSSLRASRDGLDGRASLQ